MKRLLLFGLLIGSAFSGRSQDTTLVTIKGTVVDPNTPVSFYNLLIVNKRKASGIFGEPDGSFTIRARKCDTILVGSIGYQTIPISMCDSASKAVYHVRVEVKRLRQELAEVRVIPERELKEIKKDIDELGYSDKDYMVSGIDAVSSPITFLYQSFSKREQKNRLAAQMLNEMRKRDLLKELFKKYVAYEIIDLNETQFDAFIDFCNVSDEFMQKTSQYDFIIYIKKKYELWTLVNDYRPEVRPSQAVPDYYKDR